jgi:hypothetical protein
MRSRLIALTAAIVLLGCNRPANRESGSLDTTRTGVDTSIQSTRVKDTTVVKADTSVKVDVDTTKKTDHGKDAKKDANK